MFLEIFSVIRFKKKYSVHKPIIQWMEKNAIHNWNVCLKWFKMIQFKNKINHQSVPIQTTTTTTKRKMQKHKTNHQKERKRKSNLNDLTWILNLNKTKWTRKHQQQHLWKKRMRQIFLFVCLFVCVSDSISKNKLLVVYRQNNLDMSNIRKIKKQIIIESYICQFFKC